MSSSARAQPFRGWRTLLIVGGIGAIALLLLMAPIYHPPLLKPVLGWGAPVLSKIPAYRHALLTAQTPQVTVQQLKQKLEQNPENVLLVDVRSDEEVAIARIPNSVHIPVELIENGLAIEQVQELLQNASSEDPQLILHCYSGQRSQRALAKLQEAGIEGANLKGGIKAWRDQIDPSLPEKLL